MLVAVATSALLPLVQRLEGTAADPELTARVIAMADRLGVDVGTVTVIEIADRSPAINAHVSGWGPTRAVTLYDTVGAAVSPEQIDALVAHELVHVREGDVALGTLLAALAAGSAVIIKPAPQTRRCAAVMVEALWDAGVPRDVLRFVDAVAVLGPEARAQAEQDHAGRGRRGGSPGRWGRPGLPRSLPLRRHRRLSAKRSVSKAVHPADSERLLGFPCREQRAPVEP